MAHPVGIGARALPVRGAAWCATRWTLAGAPLPYAPRSSGPRASLCTSPPAAELSAWKEWTPPARVLDVLRWKTHQGYLEQRLGTGDKASVTFWREAQTLTQQEARTQYMLGIRDLASLPHLLKASPYASAATMPLYFRMDVVRAALGKWGSMDTIASVKEQRERTRRRRLHGRQRYFIGMRLKRANTPVPTGANAVYSALVCNAIIAVAKGGAFLATGSGAMFAEAVHSVADFFNQLLLFIGLERSQREADQKHPYGYANEQFVWSLMSGVGIFFLGCGVTSYHGIQALMHPEPLHNLGVGLGTLALAGLLDGYSMLVALHEIRREAAKSGMRTWHYIRYAPDPLNVGVFLEDSAAVAGIGVAISAMALSVATGDPRWDAAGSLVISGMLGGVAWMIVQKNREVLIGQAIAPKRTHEVQSLLRADPAVLSLHDVKSVMVSPGVARFKAEVHFNAVAIADRYLALHTNLQDMRVSLSAVETDADARRVTRRCSQHLYLMLGLEVDRLEALIRSKYPEFRYIDLEPL